VWKALTDPAALRLWLMEVEGFEARVGCRFRFRAKPAPGFDGVIHCEVVDVEPPRRLSYTWASGAQRRRPTVVTWELEPLGSTTRLTLRHQGFSGLRGLLIRAMLTRGWDHKLRDYMPLLLSRLRDVSDEVERVRRGGLLECEPVPPRSMH
jgi:uncharacterized protein YndB with AHSA1/START domain